MKRIKLNKNNPGYITDDKSVHKRLKTFENNVIELSDTSVIVTTADGKTFTSKLKKIEDDSFFETFQGNYEDSTPFLLIKLNESSRALVAEQGGIEQLSISDINGKEYVFYFELIDSKEVDQNMKTRVKIDNSYLAALSPSELLEFRRQCSENRDIKLLLAIAKYRFVNSPAFLNENIYPEMCYYYGRLHQGEELREFLSDKGYLIVMLSESSMELAKKLLTIGFKFPFLGGAEISYLEQKYCDTKTFEMFDIIMFDSDQLARPIKKFDKNLLQTKNSVFSKDFLLEVFDSFCKNDELDNGYSKLYVYSRIENKIIRKAEENVGLGEFCIKLRLCSNEFFKFIDEKYGKDCSDFFAKALAKDFYDDWEELKESSEGFVGVSSYVEEIANDYFSLPEKVQDFKTDVAKSWLDEINMKDIKAYW